MRMWSSAPLPPAKPVWAGRPVSASNVMAPTNSVAERVRTTSTDAPSRVRSRAI
jgi:hypothetical protein